MPHSPNTWLELVQSWWRGDTPLGAVIMSSVRAGLRIAYVGSGGGWQRKTHWMLLWGCLARLFCSDLDCVRRHISLVLFDWVVGVLGGLGVGWGGGGGGGG
ncbi:hypothetical protein, partial [Escherichia coli]|uniref:hypothetical protein n=1 Tax=Escherichia coli TaxID=562 RepID=UPI0035D40599